MKEQLQNLITQLDSVTWTMSQIEGSGRHDEFFDSVEEFDKADRLINEAYRRLSAVSLLAKDQT